MENLTLSWITLRVSSITTRAKLSFPIQKICKRDGLSQYIHIIEMLGLAGYQNSIAFKRHLKKVKFPQLSKKDKISIILR